MSKSILTFTLIALMMGCSDIGTNPPPTIAVNTQGTSYSANGTIVVSLKNGSNTTAYFVNCGGRIGFRIERKQNNTWTDAGNVGITCLGIFQAGVTPIEPGVVNTETFVATAPGVYRLRFPYSWQYTGPANETVLSNEFIVQ